MNVTRTRVNVVFSGKRENASFSVLLLSSAISSSGIQTLNDNLLLHEWASEVFKTLESVLRVPDQGRSKYHIRVS